MPLLKDDIKSRLSKPWLLTPWPFKVLWDMPWKTCRAVQSPRHTTKLCNARSNSLPYCKLGSSQAVNDRPCSST